MESVRVFNNDETQETAYVFESGYVDFQSYDKKYDTEEAAIAAIEADGFHFVGIDDV